MTFSLKPEVPFDVFSGRKAVQAPAEQTARPVLGGFLGMLRGIDKDLLEADSL